MIILRILAKNAAFLFFGFFSAIAALVAMRAQRENPGSSRSPISES